MADHSSAYWGNLEIQRTFAEGKGRLATLGVVHVLVPRHAAGCLISILGVGKETCVRNPESDWTLLCPERDQP